MMNNMFKRYAGTMRSAPKRGARRAGVLAIAVLGVLVVAVALVVAGCPDDTPGNGSSGGDTTAPTFTTAPTVDVTTDTGATVKLTADEAGKLFWVVYAGSDASPDNAADLIADASGTTVGVARSGTTETVTTTEKTVTITGLEAGNTYNFYAVLQDSAGNNGEVSAKLEITTAMTTTTGSYTCENGTAKGGTPSGTADIVACASCQSGYKLTGAANADTTACIATQYTCENGTAKSGKPSGTADIVACASCQSGYKLTGAANADTTACVQDGTVPTFTAGPAIKAGSIGATSVTVTLTASELGQLVWVVYTEGTVPATATTLIDDASADPQPSTVVAKSAGALAVDTTTDALEIAVTGLEQNTSYDFYAVLRDAAKNMSDLSEKLVITTTNTVKYTCANGTAKGGAPSGTADVVACASCKSGFKLNGAANADNTNCIATVYTCDNGTAKSGKPSGTADIDACQSCSTGYVLMGGAANADGTTCVQDTTKPTFTQAPAVDGTTANGATVKLTASEAGKLFWVLYADGTAAPTDVSAFITAASGSAGEARSGASETVDAATEKTVTLSGLTAGSTYNFYAVLQDSAGNTGALSPKLVVTTTITARYTCENGMPKTDTLSGSTDVVACQRCDSGFKLKGDAGALNTTCVDTEYTCENGTAKTGSKPAGNSDVVACTSCKSGYKLSGAANADTTACVADSTAPAFSAGPTPDTSTDTTATLKLTASEAGKLFWVLYTDNAPAPADAATLIAAASGSSAGVQRSGDSETVDAATEKTVTIGGLAAGTSYDFYAVLQDAASNTALSTKLDIATTTVYTCTDDGMPKAGSPGGSTNVVLCASCNSGFKLMAPNNGAIGDPNTTCVATKYTCSNGTPADGKPNTNADVAQCKSCKSGYALNSNTLCAYASKDFNTLAAAGNDSPIGIWSDGTTMWVANDGDNKIYAYNMSTKARDATKDFNTLNAAGNNQPQGIWSDGTTMWVVDDGDDKLYAYNLSTKARDATKDFNTLDAANTAPQGIWSDDTTMWVVDDGDDKLYAYNLSTKARDATKDFNTLDAANTAPQGIWSDDTTMWVTNFGATKIYAYTLATKARNAAQDFTLIPFDGPNIDPTDIWSDRTTMWVMDSRTDTIYAYSLATKARDTRDTAQDFNTLTAAGNENPQGIWSDGTTVWVVDAGDDKIYAYNLATKARNSAQDFNTLTAAGNNADPRGIWSDGTTMWVVDNGDSKIYAYTMSTKARDAGKDFNTLDATNQNPRDIWSNGTTMWVGDGEVIASNKLHAYTMATKARDSTKDFNTLRAAGNTKPQGIWSDGTTMWVSDTNDLIIYAYTLATKDRDSAKDFNTLDAANIDPTGTWSDGATMWVADNTDDKIYAYPVP